MKLENYEASITVEDIREVLMEAKARNDDMANLIRKEVELI